MEKRLRLSEGWAWARGRKVNLESGRLVGLDLFLSEGQGSLGLTQIPEEVGNLDELGSLAISGNPLTTFPKEIILLTKLESLDVSNNQLVKLP